MFAKELLSQLGCSDSQTAVYVRMMYGLAGKFGDRPDLQKELWAVALQVASQGVPGSAGVALAKSVQRIDDNHVSGKVPGPWTGSIGQDLEEDAAKFCAHSMGQTSPDSITIANKALWDAKTCGNPVYIANGIQDIADLEGWGIAP